MKRTIVCVLMLTVLIASISGCDNARTSSESSNAGSKDSSSQISDSSDGSEDGSEESSSSASASSSAPENQPDSSGDTEDALPPSNISKPAPAPIIKPTKPDSGAFSPGKTLDGQNGRLRSVRYVSVANESFEKTELKMDISELPSGTNVYDESKLNLSIKLTSSTGKVITMPGFYYEDYNFRDNNQLIGRSQESPDFRLRFALTEEGTWDFVITLTLGGQPADSLSGYINAVRGNDTRGYLGVEPNRKQIFAFTNGQPFAAVGQNVCYSTETASMRSADHIKWMERMGQYGANFYRFWLNTWFLTIQKTGSSPDDFTAGLGDAAQVDKIIEAAAKLDMYIQFTAFTHNSLINNPGNSESSWAVFPYNAAAGGYLTDAADFYTDDRAKKDTKTYLRYLVARYGYSRNIMAWELFNETDLTAGTDDSHHAWHLEMTEYLREIDPYGHMVTTSTASCPNPLNQSNMFDYLTLHWYNYGTLDAVKTVQKTYWQLYQRPVMFGEIGLNRNVPASLDADLVNFHQQNWIGLMGGGAGTGANWFWTLLDNVNGYWDYQVVSEMAAHIPWNDAGMVMVDTRNVSPSDSAVEVQGYRGADYAYLWLYDSRFSQINKAVTTFDNLTLSVRLGDGVYHVRWIDTWTGVSLGKSVAAAADGYLTLTAPAWGKDIAVAITRD